MIKMFFYEREIQSWMNTAEKQSFTLTVNSFNVKYTSLIKENLGTGE